MLSRSRHAPAATGVLLLEVEDLVVDTEDALLVCAKGAAQQVKDAVEQLKEKYR